MAKALYGHLRAVSPRNPGCTDPAHLADIAVLRARIRDLQAQIDELRGGLAAPDDLAALEGLLDDARAVSTPIG